MARLCLIASVLLGAQVLLGCGATVGDPCTVPDDCNGQLCITRGETPGGYCSQQCVAGNDDSCPSGSTCVRGAAGDDLHACFLRCNDVSDCRNGYACRTHRDSAFTVCVGPD